MKRPSEVWRQRRGACEKREEFLSGHLVKVYFKTLLTVHIYLSKTESRPILYTAIIYRLLLGEGLKSKLKY